MSTKKGYKSVPWLFGKEIEIPEEWEVKKLNEITNKIGDGIHSTPEYVEHSEYYFINGNNLINGKITYFENTKNVSKEEFLKYELKLNENTILLSINGTIGNVAFYNKEKIILGKSASYIICNDKLNTLFLFYQLQSNLTKKYFSTQLTGTTISNLSLSSIRNMIFHLPLFPEQQKIASILSNINNLIESTRQVIKNSKSLKTGLVQKLLTRGISHTKFKKVPWLFGKEIEIPEEWEHSKFNQVVKTNPLTKIDEDVVPYIPMDAVDTSKDHFNYFEERKLSDYSSLPKFQENDVLFASITPSTENGKTCIIENFARKGIASSELTVLRSSDNVFPKYLYCYVKSHRIRQFAISQMMGTTGRQRVPDYVFKKDLYFELPPLPEQQKIASILSNIDAQIDSQTQYKEKLERLKKSLMQKLLTGEVRVAI